MKINENTKVTLTISQLKKLVKEGKAQPVKRRVLGQVAKKWFESFRGRRYMEKQIEAWFEKKNVVDSCSCIIDDYGEGGTWLCFSLDVDISINHQNDRDTHDIVLGLVEKCPLIRKYIVPAIPCDDRHWTVYYNQGEGFLNAEELTNIGK